MRPVLFVLLILICVAAAGYYAIVGGAARADRRAKLTELAGDYDEVRGLLEKERPLSAGRLETVHRSIERRRADIERFRDHVLGFASASAPTIESLTDRAAELGLDAGLTRPLLAGLSDRDTDVPRRRALGALLRAVGETREAVEGSVRIERLHLAPQISGIETRDDLPLLVQRLDAELIGSPRAVVHALELVLAGSDTIPPSDLVRTRLTPSRPDEWDRLGQEEAAPPVRLELVVDFVAGRTP